MPEDSQLKPFPKKHPITEVKDGRTYYLIKMPSLEGLTEKSAQELVDQLIKAGYRDAYVENLRGYYYVYGDPGVTVDEVENIIKRFTYIENVQEIYNNFKWATFSEVATEEWFYVHCEHCGYQWKTQSKMNLVTCPSCGFKTPRRERGGIERVEKK
jgi:rubrerythrin